VGVLVVGGCCGSVLLVVLVVCWFGECVSIGSGSVVRVCRCGWGVRCGIGCAGVCGGVGGGGVGGVRCV
jgi:hypothetical protein